MLATAAARGHADTCKVLLRHGVDWCAVHTHASCGLTWHMLHARLHVSHAGYGRDAWQLEIQKRGLLRCDEFLFDSQNVELTNYFDSFLTNSFSIFDEFFVKIRQNSTNFDTVRQISSNFDKI